VEFPLRPGCHTAIQQHGTLERYQPSKARMEHMGQRKIEEKKFLSGYVLVDMIVTDESWFLIRNTPNVKRILGAGTIPIPVTDMEFGKIKKHMGDSSPKVKVDFLEGDPVTITKGPFSGYEGQVSQIDPKGKVVVLVSMFGRDTPVELDHDSVKKR